MNHFWFANRLYRVIFFTSGLPCENETKTYISSDKEREEFRMRKFKKALAFALASAMIVSAVPASAAAKTNSAKGTKSTIYTYTVDKSKKADANNKRSWIKVTAKKGYTYKLVNKTKDIVSLTKTRVEAKKTGTAKINVNFYKNGKYVETKSVKITVKKAPMIGKVTLDKTEVTAGETTKVSNAGKGTAYFYSSNKDVATVDKTTGEITAKAAGTTTISAVNTITKARVYLTLTVNAQFGAAQTGASEITVTGSDLANKDITVKKGNSTVTVSKKEVSEDGKTATLTTASKIVASDYTVTAGDKTATFKGEASRVENIEILGENLVMNGEIGLAETKVGTVGYKVTNQFNEDITDNTSLTANASGATVVVSKGKATVTFTTAPKLNDPVSLVLIYQETGKTATAMLKVSNKAVPYTIVEKGVYNENNKPLTATNLGGSEEFNYLFQVKDQYGNEITDEKVLSGSFYVNCAAGLTNTKAVTNADIKTKKVNGTTYFALPIQKDPTKDVLPGEITYILTAGGSGQSLTAKVTVEAGAIVNTIDVTAPDVVSANEEKVEFSFTALDKDGNEVTDVKQLERVLPATTRFSFVKEGDKVKLYLNTTGLTAGQTYSEVFQTPTYNTKVVLVNVKEGRYPAEIIGLKDGSNDFATAQLLGKNIVVKKDNIKLNDQYGNSIDLDSTNYKIEVVDYKADDVFESNTASGDEILNIKAKEAGTKEVTFAIKKANGEDVIVNNGQTNITKNGQFTVTFTAVSESRINSYTVADVAKIYGGSGSTATTPDAYALKDVDVYGVVSSGVKVKLEKDKDYAITPGTNLTTLTTVSGGGIGYKGKTSTTDLDAKFQVVINSNGQVIEKSTKVSFTKPVVDKVEIKDSKTYLTVAATSGSSINVAEKVLADLKATDTYGKELELTGNTAKYVDDSEASVQVVVSDVSSKDITIKKNGTDAVTIEGAKENDSFKVTVTIGGKAFSANVQVTK